MLHLPPLIQDLAVILTMAALAALLFQKLRLPVILGYLVAGLLVGPHVEFLPTVIDRSGMQVWADIGVIVLLFTIGLEFSLRKVAHSGRTAIPAGLFEIAFMLGLGFLSGRLLGWSPIESLFLGGLLSVSSTTIIFRILGDMGLMSRSFVPLVVGILLVEDVIAVLLIVLLTTVSVTRTLEGSAMLWSAARLGFFLVLWVVLGTLLVPRFIQRVARDLSEEMALVVGLGLCFLMVVIAVESGFSPAFGAFVMGSLLAETEIGPRLRALIHPVRDLFGAVFFISVGTLVDPEAITTSPMSIVVIAAVAVLGRAFAVSMGAVIAGEPLNRALRAGFCLAQIGEFSFVIAALGVTLKVIDPKVPSIAIAVSAITMFLAPIFMARSTLWAMRIQLWLPEAWYQRLEAYRHRVVRRSSSGFDRDFWWILLKMAMNAVLIIAITLATDAFFIPHLEPVMNPTVADALCGALALVVATPFFWGLIAVTASGRRESGRRSIMGIARIAVALGLLLFMLNRFSPGPAATIGVLVVAFTAPIWGRRFARTIYLRFEEQLRQQFTSSPSENKPILAPWDATLADFVVPPDSDLIGHTLMESAMKERYGVAVTMVERGSEKILAPGRDTVIYPGDRLFLIGTDQQLDEVAALFRPKETVTRKQVDYGLSSMSLQMGSPFIGRTIRNSGLREQIDGLIVGLERNGERLLNPDSGMVLQTGDLLWIVGDLDKI